MIKKTHHFFLLNLSPWPFIISLSSFNFMLSLLNFLKYDGTGSLVSCLLNLSFCALFWWVFYSVEFNLEGKNSFLLEKGVKLSMILFISSEIFFFFSFFWSYFHYFLSPSIELGLSWPPVYVEFFDFLGVPLINTMVLMSSGLSVTISHYFLLVGKSYFKFWLGFTILLGGLFSYLQYLEYKNSFFCISDGSFGSSFFMLTGFHGFHVLIGSIFLFATLSRSISLAGSSSNFLNFELASWYWHFVDVVWIFLYCFIYYLVS